MRKKILAGNWKMHKTLAELPGYFSEYARAASIEGQGVRLLREQFEIIFAVPYPLLHKASQIAAACGITIAAQNVHYAPSGAFTGEVSLAMLKELGIRTTLIGHSERRQYFGETDEAVAEKVKACYGAEVRPIVCLGETKDERLANLTSQVITKQFHAAFSKVDSIGDAVIAYEPVWAIGTGLSATSQQAQEAHRLLRNLAMKRFGEQAGKKISILYGGSASPANIDELMTQPDIDGALVGGASLKPLDFAAMTVSIRGTLVS